MAKSKAGASRGIGAKPAGVNPAKAKAVREAERVLGAAMPLPFQVANATRLELALKTARQAGVSERLLASAETRLREALAAAEGEKKAGTPQATTERLADAADAKARAEERKAAEEKRAAEAKARAEERKAAEEARRAAAAEKARAAAEAREKAEAERRAAKEEADRKRAEAQAQAKARAAAERELRAAMPAQRKSTEVPKLPQLLTLTLSLTPTLTLTLTLALALALTLILTLALTLTVIHTEGGGHKANVTVFDYTQREACDLWASTCINATATGYVDG